MSREETWEKVRDVVAEQLAMPAGEVRPDLSIGDVPQWSSMTNIAIITALEDRFGIEFPPERLLEMTCASALVDAVMAQLGQKEA